MPSVDRASSETAPRTAPHSHGKRQMTNANAHSGQARARTDERMSTELEFERVSSTAGGGTAPMRNGRVDVSAARRDERTGCRSRCAASVIGSANTSVGSRPTLRDLPPDSVPTPEPTLEPREHLAWHTPVAILSLRSTRADRTQRQECKRSLLARCPPQSTNNSLLPCPTSCATSLPPERKERVPTFLAKASDGARSKGRGGSRLTEKDCRVRETLPRRSRCVPRSPRS